MNVGPVNDWLKRSYNIDVSEDWLSTCIEFICQETQGSRPNLDQLKRLVFEQWLGSDLSEIAKPSIPDDVYTCDKCQLHHVYPLQMISIIDVATPLYGQIQKLQANDSDSNLITFSDNPFDFSTGANQTFSNSKPSRMLKLELTDGHRNLQAIEYRPIKALNVDLPSGTKILIKGSVLSRRQVLLLQEDNVCVMGGEVDDLIVVNNPLMNLQAELERNRQLSMSDGNS